jgi:glyoxylase-like metal-dependent hydrolase (beta-lactamase superfamily II)
VRLVTDPYEIVLVNYGRRQTVKSEVFLNFAVYREADEPIGMDYFFWVIRNRSTTVVVDIGFSTRGGSTRGRDMLIEPLDALAALGISPVDAPTVVVTHAHYDHIGNLAALPRSPIVMAEQEWDFWGGDHRSRPLFHHSIEEEELAALEAAIDEGRVTLFQDRITLAPGIEVICVGGHTPGQSVVKVTTRDGVVLLGADAVHYDEELERDRPFAHVASVAGTYEALDLIRAWREAGEIALVVSGHDPAARELGVPVTTGPLAGLARIIAPLGDAA